MNRSDLIPNTWYIIQYRDEQRYRTGYQSQKATVAGLFVEASAITADIYQVIGIDLIIFGINDGIGTDIKLQHLWFIIAMWAYDTHMASIARVHQVTRHC